MIFTKTRNVKAPSRAFPTDAGIDFFVPEYSEELATIIESKSMLVYRVSEDEIILQPGANVLIPLGIKVIVDEGTALVAFNKSGIASKKGLLVGACCVDAMYTGEVHLNLINATSVAQSITWGSKIIQFIQLKIDQHQPTEISEEEYSVLSKQETEKTSRGSDGFGSTGVR